MNLVCRRGTHSLHETFIRQNISLPWIGLAFLFYFARTGWNLFPFLNQVRYFLSFCVFSDKNQLVVWLLLIFNL